MSTVFCQGLQSCLEPQLVETTTLRLKLVPPIPTGFRRENYNDDDTSSNPPIHVHAGETQISSNLEMAGWSFLQSLSNSSHIPKQKMQLETSYVPPIAKLSSSMLKLSEKSLELCTESLGSETGSDTTESCIFSLSATREQHNPRLHVPSRKETSRHFPPPLTTISGSNSLRIRPHREGGRLIMEVIEASSTNTCFQAQRSDGRLRLTILRSNEEENQEDEEEEEEFDQQEKEYDFEEEEGEESDEYLESDICRMGMDKFQRPSRCKEGGHGDKGLCNWEPFWVATS